jgi:hypothetical protein
VVAVDLQSVFDRVIHDILIDRLGRTITDRRIIRLVRPYLDAGIMDAGIVQQRVEGTPQGGPPSPLLANVLLDEVDKELERRGHTFVCYADDANVYVRSRKTGERVMRLLRKLYGRLRLTINETKSAVASVLGRRFLGFSVWVAPPKDHQTLCLRQGPQGLPGPCPGAHALERRPQPQGRDRRASYLCPRLERLLPSSGDGGKPDHARRVAANSPRWRRDSGTALNAVLTNRWLADLGAPSRS